MTYWTSLIIKAAQVSALAGDQDMNYYVHCAYGEVMGYGSTDMLSMSVKDELKALGYSC